MAELQFDCFNCGLKLSFIDSVSRREECIKCRADVRVCKNCEFYDPKVYNECRETSADPVREKERANLCDFFRPHGTTVAGAAKSREDLLAAAEALFKKK